MNKEMKDLAVWAMEKAKLSGADDSAAYIKKHRFVEIAYRDKKPETIKEASKKSLYIEIYVNGRYSGQSTSDLRKEPLRTFISNAVDTTRLLAEDKYRSLTDPKYYKGRAKVDLEIADKSHKELSPDKRHAMVKQMETACLDKGGDKVISAMAMVHDSVSESVMITSNGFEGHKRSTVFWGGAEMTVQDEGDRRPSGWDYKSARKMSALPAPTEIGKNAAVRTLDLLGAKKIKTETLPVIIENRNVSRVLSGFLSGLYGKNIQQKRSFLADKKGQKVGSDKFTLLDDPLIIGGLGSKLYDGDGISAKKRTIMEKGTVKEFLVDWYYSRKLGWEPTTGSTSNLILPPGKRSVDQIMKDLGRGILITGFLGGNSNSTTGDFSRGIIGHLFVDGVPVQAVSEMNIADNHLKFWNKLAETANDPYMYSSYRMPSLVFTDVVVSGL